MELEPFEPPHASHSLEPFSPGRELTKRMMILSPPIPIFPPLRVIPPPPGAVCPAIVLFPFTTTSDLRLIVPPTSNTIILPVCETASRKEPAPLSLRFVT